MKTIKISDQDMEYIRSLIENDIKEVATDTSFFSEMKLDPHDFINQMSDMAARFGLDFWRIIGRNCTAFESKRIRALYEGKPSGKIISDKKTVSSKRRTHI